MSSEKRANTPPQFVDFAAERRQQVYTKIDSPLAEMIKATGIDGKLAPPVFEQDIAIYLDNLFNHPAFHAKLATLVDSTDGKFFWEAVEGWLTNSILQQNNIAEDRYADVYAIVKTKLHHHFFARYRTALNPTQTSLQFKTSDEAKLVSAYFNIFCFNNSEHSLKPNGTQSINNTQATEINSILWPESGDYTAVKYLNFAILSLKAQKVDQAVRYFTWYLECYPLHIAPLALTNPDFIRQFLLNYRNSLILLQTDYQQNHDAMLSLNQQLKRGQLNETNLEHQDYVYEFRTKHQNAVENFLSQPKSTHKNFVEKVLIPDQKFKALLTACGPKNLSFSNLAEVSAFLETVFENNAVYVELANRLQNSAAPNATEWDTIKKSLVSTIQLTAKDMPAEQVKDFISAKIDLLFLQQYKKAASQQNLTFPSADSALGFCSYFNTFIAKSDDQLLWSNDRSVKPKNDTNALIARRNQVLTNIQNDYLSKAKKAIQLYDQPDNQAEKDEALTTAKDAFITYLELIDLAAQENADLIPLKQNKAEIEVFLKSEGFNRLTEKQKPQIDHGSSIPASPNGDRDEMKKEEREAEKKQPTNSSNDKFLLLEQKIFSIGAENNISESSQTNFVTSESYDLSHALVFDDIGQLSDFLTHLFNNKDFCEQINRLYDKDLSDKITNNKLFSLFSSICRIKSSTKDKDSEKERFFATFIKDKLHAIFVKGVENPALEAEQKTVYQKILTSKPALEKDALGKDQLVALKNILLAPIEKDTKKYQLQLDSAALHLLAYVAVTEDIASKDWSISNEEEALVLLSSYYNHFKTAVTNEFPLEKDEAKLARLKEQIEDKLTQEKQIKEYLRKAKLEGEQRRKAKEECRKAKGEGDTPPSNEKTTPVPEEKTAIPPFSQQSEETNVTRFKVIRIVDEEFPAIDQRSLGQATDEGFPHNTTEKFSPIIPHKKGENTLDINQPDEAKQQQKSNLLQHLENYRYPLIARILAGIAWCITYPAVWFGARPAFDRFLDKQNLTTYLIDTLQDPNQDNNLGLILTELKTLSPKNISPPHLVADEDFRPSNEDVAITRLDRKPNSDVPPSSPHHYHFFTDEKQRDLMTEGRFFNQIVKPIASENDANTNHPQSQQIFKK